MRIIFRNAVHILTIAKDGLVDLTSKYLAAKIESGQTKKENKEWNVALEHDAIQYPYGESVALKIKCTNYSEVTVFY